MHEKRRFRKLEKIDIDNVWSAARLRGLVWARDKSAQMYSAFRWRLILLARMRCARVGPYKSHGRWKTIIGIRLRTRRCDCSFVLAAPVQTSVGELINLSLE